MDSTKSIASAAHRFTTGSNMGPRVRRRPKFDSVLLGCACAVRAAPLFNNAIYIFVPIDIALSCLIKPQKRCSHALSSGDHAPADTMR